MPIVPNFAQQRGQLSCPHSGPQALNKFTEETGLDIQIGSRITRAQSPGPSPKQKKHDQKNYENRQAGL